NVAPVDPLTQRAQRAGRSERLWFFDRHVHVAVGEMREHLLTKEVHVDGYRVDVGSDPRQRPVDERYAAHRQQRLRGVIGQRPQPLTTAGSQDDSYDLNRNSASSSSTSARTSAARSGCAANVASASTIANATS